MKRLLPILIVCAFVTAPAIANITGTAYITHTGHVTDGYITIYGSKWINGVTAYGGIYTWNKLDSTGTGDLLAYNYGFCIDLAQAPQNGWHDVRTLEDVPLPLSQYSSPMGALKADALSELWARYFNPLWYTRQNSLDKIEAEAFSAAVWEIVYEDMLPWDVTTWDTNNRIESFKATNCDTTLANYWLNSLTLDGTGPTAMLVGLSRNDGQDFVTQIFIPAPGTLFLGGLGVGLVGLLKRYKRL